MNEGALLECEDEVLLVTVLPILCHGMAVVLARHLVLELRGDDGNAVDG